MATTWGITVLPSGFTVPDGCEPTKVSHKKSLDAKKNRSRVGTTVRNIPKRLITEEWTTELDGIAPLSLCVAGEFTPGTPKITRIRVQEIEDETPKSTITHKAYSTRT